MSCFSDYGAVRLHHGRADWTIDPSQHSYLWETMLYFFGTVAAPEIRFAGWDARGWLGRARKRRPTIHVSNVDLLFRVPHLGRWQLNAEQNDRTLRNNPPADRYKEIQFIAPHQVRVISKVPNGLEPHEVRVESVYSLISSGTELKIFKGLFEDASLDVNIKGMEEERMAYPLAYGYSLVGRIVECGRGVEGREQLLGRLVFTFSAHSSQVTADLSAVHLVPDGIGALDAIFMPSVETALSLVQDARPLLGEKIAVFGQGLIGLLVTALLRRHAIHSSSGFGTITTFDTLRDRLAASSAMGASQALMPSEAASTGPFDVSIEVSGSGRALQTAIDSTRDGGRIVIGSWYGDKVINLKLGTDFHRSHKTLKASQVSTLPSEMMKTWTKERRFALTWDLVRDIRPSCLLTRTTTIDYAQEAYEALEKGNEIAVAFEYN
jgi:threonine dehydrogenase-like Zn-dependent dehydrogenase